MKKTILLRLDPWTRTALWLIVLLLAADRIRPPSPLSSAQAADTSAGATINVNLAAVGGTPVDASAGLPVRQVGPPPSTRVGPGPFPFEKTSP